MIVSITSLKMPNGQVVMPGDLVEHTRTGVRGFIIEITGPSSGAGAIRLRVHCADLEAAKRTGDWWPLEGGRTFIEIRDAGLPLSRFTIKAQADT